MEWEAVDAELDREKVQEVLKKFESYFSPRTNVPFERHQFNSEYQNEGESVDSYVTELKCLAKSCEFAELTDSLIKDWIVCGIGSNTDYCEKKNWLQSAINIYRASESTEKWLKSMAGTSSDNIGVVRRKTNKKAIS